MKGYATPHFDLCAECNHPLEWITVVWWPYWMLVHHTTRLSACPVVDNASEG